MANLPFSLVLMFLLLLLLVLLPGFGKCGCHGQHAVVNKNSASFCCALGGGEHGQLSSAQELHTPCT